MGRREEGERSCEGDDGMGLWELGEVGCFCCACSKGDTEGEEHFRVQQVVDDRVDSSHYFRHKFHIRYTQPFSSYQ